MGVVTEREVELLTEPSDAVTTTTVVEVEGVALVVAEVLDVVAAVVSEGSVALVAPADVVVGVGVESALVGLVVAAEVVVGSADVLVVASAVVADVLVVSAAEEVVVSADEVVVAAAVFPLPLVSACLLKPTSFTSRRRNEASMRKAWVAVVADSAATSSLSNLAECMAVLDEKGFVRRRNGRRTAYDTTMSAL